MHAELSKVIAEPSWWWGQIVVHQEPSSKSIQAWAQFWQLCMQCMQAACTPVKMKLITPAIDWSFLVFLTLLPTSACFFSSLIWPLFTPWVTSGLYFLLHQNQLHPEIDKINGHLPHTKKLHIIISKLQVTETQKWCRIFYEKEEVFNIRSVENSPKNTFWTFNMHAVLTINNCSYFGMWQ